MTEFAQIEARLSVEPHRWLITGVAGFIGSHLLEALLKLNQHVIGLDNFSTGHQYNLRQVQSLVTSEQWSSFKLIEGDIRDLADCQKACQGVEYVLHQAALGSVPRSLEDPVLTNSVNISGFLNMMVAARSANVENFIYAASSSTYGDHPSLPKVEDKIGKPLSPYAVSKYANELYADVFNQCYGFNSIGLRYFNVFGPRQDPRGAYAAVIPKWTAALLAGDSVYINGDGETSRDFCFVANVVEANLLAATTLNPEAKNNIYNIALGDSTTLSNLFCIIRDSLYEYGVSADIKPLYRQFRAGDVRHSRADISKAQYLLRYAPQYRLAEGIAHTIPWYVAQNSLLKKI